jgi:hypothetical protein
VIPVFAIMCLEGLNTLYSLLDRVHFATGKKILAVALLGGMVYYCFFFPPTRLDYHHNFTLNEDQRMVAQIATFVEGRYPDHTPYFSDVTFSYLLDIDQFGPKGEYLIRDTDYGNKLQEKELIIWDGWRSKGDEQIPRMVMDTNPNLKLDTSFAIILNEADTIEYLLYVKR